MSAQLSPAAEAFVEEVKRQAAKAFAVYRATNTITSNGTVGFTERIPGEDKLVSVSYPGPWDEDKPLQANVVGLDGTVYLGQSRGDRWIKLFAKHPDITTISHVHAPKLGAWAQTHRTLPIRYVPVQRNHLIREIPVYIDRRQSQEDFILDQLEINPHNTAILEANGGATVWGREGLRKTAEFILLLEEGAGVQIEAESIGGSREYGPGVLQQQWGRRNLVDKARELGFSV
ncbi:class II aldolase/adducin family protein [Janthinobacterium sp. 17J80-10]|uniref:class II aldolase/adducin family protein n=1 Tax=Janthinobacterium sp. 17J80-10 TaxID=2497863 RepID=UPI0010055790|nr:class II aldolase/adducin family protein [Janthinobacterium sp. 17J80-10]QAU33984.1 class II aldolase/adducin family protein [Janthinobacterium sp. 17J80-10]